MLFHHPRHHPPDLNIFRNNHAITVNQHKHLGVKLSSTLSWSPRVEHLISRSSAMLGLLRHLHAYFHFSSRCLLKVYLEICYILPLLEYGCSSFVGLFVRALLASLKLCNRRHCPFVALILLVSLPFVIMNAVALYYSDFSFLFLMTMSLTTCPVSVIGHLSTLPLHAHYAIHLPFAFHALAHPCFCPLLSTSLLLPTTLPLQSSELNFCLSLLLPSILLMYSGSSSLKLILNFSIFPCDFCYLMKRK